MRRIIYGLVLALGIGFAGLSGAQAAPLSSEGIEGLTVLGSGVQKVYSGRYCDRLRLACVYKNERGEEGMGNCRRYREECGTERRVSCRSLRRACEYKHERGEVGEGNCRRYREQCGGGRY